MNGGMIIWPIEVPTLVSPVTKPLLLLNQRATVESGTTSCVPIPRPTKIANIRRICQGFSTSDIRTKPEPYPMPETIRTILGPNLSLKCPAKSARMPIIKKAIAEQLDRRVRDQPNSSSNSLKSTPKANNKPITTNCVRKAPLKAR